MFIVDRRRECVERRRHDDSTPPLRKSARLSVGGFPHRVLGVVREEIAQTIFQPRALRIALAKKIVNSVVGDSGDVIVEPLDRIARILGELMQAANDAEIDGGDEILEIFAGRQLRAISREDFRRDRTRVINDQCFETKLPLLQVFRLQICGENGVIRQQVRRGVQDSLWQHL